MSTQVVNNLKFDASESKVVCAHCGLPVPLDMINSERHASFCCQGCEVVYSLLQACHLEEYYRLRDTFLQSKPDPVKTSRAKFTWIDDQAVLEKHAKVAQDGCHKVFLYLDNIHCLACVWLVEKMLLEQLRVRYARLNLSNHVLEVLYNPLETKLSAVAQTLDKLGYTPHLIENKNASAYAEKESKSLLARMGVAAASAGNIMLLAVSQYFGDSSGIEPEHSALFRWVSFGLALPAVFYSGYPFYKSAFLSLKNKAVSIELPITMGILGAFLVSIVSVFQNTNEVYFDTLSMLIFLLLIGRFAVSRAGKWAALSTETLLMSSLNSIKKVKDGTVEQILFSQVEIGDRLQFFPGETICVDGIVESNSAYLRESHLSGESMPVVKHKNEEVFSGTVVEVSPIEITATAIGETTRAAKLAEQTRLALGRNAKIVTALDKISAFFVAGMILLSMTTAIIWYQFDSDRWIWNAVSVLIITCPCALGLAAPVVLATATARAARNGIFIKNPETLYQLTQVDHVIFDKTGTVTDGHIRVLEKHFREDLSSTQQQQILNSLAALEKDSGHIYSVAFAAYQTENCHVSELRFIKGSGIEGIVNGVRYAVGSKKFISSQVAFIPEQIITAAAEMARQGQTVLFVSQDHQVKAVVGLGDSLKSDADKVIGSFLKSGLKVELMSGDNREAVTQKAHLLGISDFSSDVSPEQKFHHVDDLENNGYKTAMIGDGINDAAAIKRATVGISVTNASDIARDASDIFITSKNFKASFEIFKIAKQAYRKIQLILWISVLYNTVGAVLAVSGMLNPLIAAIMMPISSVTVLLIASRA